MSTVPSKAAAGFWSFGGVVAASVDVAFAVGAAPEAGAADIVCGRGEEVRAS
jgi:hypothetical protein